MEDRSKRILVVMRQILRATDTHARLLSRLSGVTTSQLLALQLLDERGESTAGEIASSMGITQATTTSLLQKLEAAGLIARRRGDTDRRQVWLSLTDLGREKLANAPVGLQETFSERFEALEQWEQAMLIAAMERIAAMLDAENIDAAPLLDIGAVDRDRVP